ncbi:MAG: hypothetical protein M3506_04375 [Chloroflexota bacterium]|nr:hypothetical protein [Chloroflexota bacterium]
MRSHHTRGKLFTRLDDLLDTLSSALKELMDNPERVRSLTGRAWLYAK